MNKLKIFYAHSSRDSLVYESYNKVCNNEELNKKIKIYDYEDKTTSEIISNSLFNQIYECDLFIIDITPDNVIDDKVYFNEHIMIELGIALTWVDSDKILIIYNSNKYDFVKNKNKIPVFIEGRQLNNYEYNDDSVIEIIKNFINNVDTNEFNNNEWETFKYNFTSNFKEQIGLIIKNNYNNFVVKYNNERIIIFINNKVNKKIYIDVNNYAFNTKSEFKNIDLSKNDIILNELRHLQLLVKFDLCKS